MKLEQQVCSLDLAKRLKELRVKQESLFYWCDYADGYRDEPAWNLEENHVGYKLYLSAFTVAELGEMLPIIVREDSDTQWLYATKHDGGYSVQYGSIEHNAFKIAYEQYADTEADARAKMLIYLLENKLV